MTNKADDQFGRLYMINSLTHIFHEACKSITSSSTKTTSTTRTTMTRTKSKSTWNSSLSRLNKLASTLINYLIITKLRPSVAHNCTYFELIEKLKSIKTYLEPWSSLSSGKPTSSSNSNPAPTNNNNNNSTSSTSLLDFHIDSFREHVDKNLNSFFARVHLRSLSSSVHHRRQKVTALNAHIVQLELIKRLLFSTSDASFDNKLRMRQKISLGHLITRNFLQILLNSFARLNDYLAFYFYLKSAPRWEFYTLDALLNLLEPALFIVKCIVLNLEARPDRLVLSASGLSTLFRFYALFNHLIVASMTATTTTTAPSTTGPHQQRRTLKQIYSEKCRELLQASINDRMRLVDVHLQTIFASLADRVALLNELARFCLDAPVFMLYGVRLFLDQLGKSKTCISEQLNVRFYN